MQDIESKKNYMQNPEDRNKNYRTISVSKANYEKMIEMGNMKTSFNDLVTDLMRRANVIDGSASASLNAKRE